MVRPFTLGRLADIIRLARVFNGISSDHVENAMMVTRDRAVELLKQAAEMKLVRVDGSLYHSTSLGSAFFEALKSNDRTKLDNILSEYPPYFLVKNVLLERSADIKELKKITGLTEVAVEIILRLLRYVRDDFYSMHEKFFIRLKHQPDTMKFHTTLRNIYKEINRKMQWGQPKEYIRLDKIASNVCTELRISIDDFSSLLSQLLESSFGIEIHSEVAGYQFIPFSRRKLNPSLFRKCYLRLRGEPIGTRKSLP
jgi:hypothetical protein